MSSPDSNPTNTAAFVDPGDAFDRWRATRHFVGLDALRATAVLLVVVHHSALPALEILHGYLGVTIFFVISGFLITTLSLREERSRGQVSLRAFYVRRTLRIFPLYYLVLAVYCVLILGLGQQADGRAGFVHALPYYLTYMQEIPGLLWSGSRPFLFSWSLGIEEKFYLVYPFLLFVLLRHRPRRASLTLALAIATYCSPWLHPNLEVIRPYSFILIGSLLALGLDRRETFERLVWLGHPAAQSASLALLALSCIWAGDIARVPVAICTAAIIGGLAIGPSTRVAGAMSWGIVSEVGRLSYGIYLTHLLCLNVAERLVGTGGWHGIAGLAIALALTISVSMGLRKWVEKPMIDRGQAWSSRLRSA